jgi:DNA-binding CsgD family transcriptional regulator
MIHGEEQVIAVSDAFYAAALGRGSWYSALEGLAAATGSRVGQLISLGSNATVPINVMTNIDPAAHQAFLDCGGGDPRINPRVNAGASAPIHKVLAECDFISADEHRRHPHYDEFARPWDIPFICLTTLARDEDMLIGLAVARSQSEGHISSEQRAVFSSLAPHVRAAVRMQMALEEEGAALLTGAMEALSTPAFVCDSTGRVKAMTPSAEAMVARGRSLQLQGGKLSAALAADSASLKDAIELAACEPSSLAARLPRTVIVRCGEQDAMPMVLDVIALPARTLEFCLAPRVLVVVHGTQGADSRRRKVLKSVYGLTAAETDVALQVAQGRTTEAIAAARGVVVDTVRAQIKSILAKLGFTRQIELVARLNQL